MFLKKDTPNMSKTIQAKRFLKHQPRHKGILKFLLLLIVLLGYFACLSFEYGLATGGLVAA